MPRNIVLRNEVKKWVIAIVLCGVTFFVYSPSLQNGFVNWDDSEYVYENPNIRTIDFKLLKWSLTAVVGALWHPLTLLSLAMDHALWGLTPWGYHLTNVLFHTFNTFLVFIVVVKLVGCGSFEKGVSNEKALISGTVTALLFGIHPLHVESVAWVSERKDVLSAFFFLLALLAYLKYVSLIGHKRYIAYGASLFLFVLALLSKPMALSLPVVLLILDFYPLKRITTGMARKNILAEKLPFFLLSILSGVITIWAHRSVEALGPIETYPLMARIFVAAHSYLFYLFKMIIPLNLAPFYPYPFRENVINFAYVGAFIIFLIITFVCIRSLNRYKIFFAVWFYYVVTLIPVIGIIKVGEQAAADRYTYLPSLGPFILAGLGISCLFDKYKKREHRIAIIGVLILASGFFAVKTIRQNSVWKDSITLWSHEIKLFPDKAAVAYINRGKALVDIGSYQPALTDFNDAIRINPLYAYAYYNRGHLYYDKDVYRQALMDYSKAIEINPRYANAYGNRGNIYYLLGNYPEAIKDYIKTIELKPEAAMPYYNLGLLYSKLEDSEKAQYYFSRAKSLGIERR